VEAVFKALGDRHRRRLLDRLYRQDGQTLGQLTVGLAMTRFGVMKHLRLLEDAGLVTTRRVGREKRHYLNPVPIRRIHDRWISKFAEPWVGGLSRLKTVLEEDAMSAPKHVYEVYIRTTPEKLWEAITDPELTVLYFHGSRVDSKWQVGDAIVHRLPDGKPALEGKVLEIDPPRRLVTTFKFAQHPEGRRERPSRVTWEIEPQGTTCRLTLTHDDFDGETVTYREVARGWNPVLSGLKTLLETGKPLVIG